jgi:hypothetical protein
MGAMERVPGFDKVADQRLTLGKREWIIEHDSACEFSKLSRCEACGNGSYRQSRPGVADLDMR